MPASTTLVLASGSNQGLGLGSNTGLIDDRTRRYVDRRARRRYCDSAGKGRKHIDRFMNAEFGCENPKHMA